MAHNRECPATLAGMPVRGFLVGVADHIDHFLPREERRASHHGDGFYVRVLVSFCSAPTTQSCCLRGTFKSFRVNPLKGIVHVVGVVFQKKPHTGSLEDPKEHIDRKKSQDERVLV